ncbi:ribokinase [Agrobacterium tumefaciens]|nr:ribokinase [Agrobacterium tumefaciens]
MVFDDQAVHAAFDEALGIAHAGIIDGVHARVAITRRSRKRRAMDHADQRLAATENFLDSIGRVVGYGLHFSPFRKFSMRAFVIGNIALDETYSIAALPQAGASIFGEQASRSLGGKGCNQAIVLARCGVETTLVAAVGTDDRAIAIGKSLTREHLTPKLIPVDSATSDISIILTTPDGENSIITTRSAAAALDRDAALDALGDTVSGDLVILQGNLSEETTLVILNAARSKGLTTAFNPSPLQPWFASILPLIDIAVLNRIEAEALTGESGAGAGAFLLRAGVGLVIITLGGQGCVLVSANGAIEVAAAPATIVDTTGAGDCFTGVALASAIRRGVAIDARALEDASRAAAITVGRRGTQDAFPSHEEMMAILRA